MERHDIYLVPGFFGFAKLGDISYFHHVREVLGERLADHGIEAQIESVRTPPTASIPTRVQRLAEEIGEVDRPLHLVGHSTGGLDARLFVTPGMSVPGVDREDAARRVETVTSVATPHFGTPVASFFDGLFGQKLLYVTSLATIYTLRFGELPLKYLMRLIGLVSKLDDTVGLDETVVDQVHRDLFSQFGPELQEEIRGFLDQIVTDRSALGQLTPGSIDLFNAAVADDPEVRYGCVVTRTPRLSVDNVLEAGFNPYKQASHLLFQLVRQVSARGKLKLPSEVENKRGLLRTGFDGPPDSSDSDGVVPTLSQVWGELIRSVRADHLDVCGHFDDPAHDPPHVDWLVSGSTFERPQFEGVWSDVAAFIAGGVGG